MRRICRGVRRVVIGTHNQDKLRELRRLLAGARIEVLSLDQVGRPVKEAVEDGRTYEANARKKASSYARQTGLLTLADDSGLSVPSLSGRPGIYSARFAGPGCTYRDNNRKLLRLLAKKPGGSRRAKFVCVMALCDGRGAAKVARGECAGTIAPESRGSNGFGYDPVFIPDGFKKTFAQLSARTKNRISHRGKALRQARQIILRHFRR